MEQFWKEMTAWISCLINCWSWFKYQLVKLYQWFSWAMTTYGLWATMEESAENVCSAVRNGFKMMWTGSMWRVLIPGGEEQSKNKKV